ncbi:MAG: hypothetical protein AMXMBFR13_28910 [Phycisphaerae bacterium]
MNMAPTHIALALVERDGRWLVSRRAPGRVFAGLWEFPGGKMAGGERAEDAAVRETLEETGLEVGACGFLGELTTQSGDGPVVLHLVLCRTVSGEARPADPAVEAVAWVTTAELAALSMPPANAQIVAWIREQSGPINSAGTTVPSGKAVRRTEPSD